MTHAPNKTKPRKRPPRPGEGRPTKYRPEMCEQALKFGLLGLTETEIARFLDTNHQTLYEWKRAYPEFAEALKRGGVPADSNVARALYERALGYRVTEQQVVKLTTTRYEGGNKIVEERIEIVEIVKQLPPDPASMAIWLKNRQQERWRERKEIAMTGSLEHKIATMTDAELDVWSRDLAARAQAILESPVIEGEAFEIEPDEGGEDPAAGTSEEP